MKMNRFEYLLMTFDLGRRLYLRGIVRRLLEISKPDAGGKVLEIGCGNGVGSQLIEEMFRPGKFIATEFDPRLVEIARTKNRGSRIVFQEASATDLPFQNGEFDALIGLSVIHHIPEWRRCIAELFRVLRPGGLLILKELSIETFQSSVGRLARRVVSHPYDSMLGKSEFLDHLERSGFRVVICLPHAMPLFLRGFLLVAVRDRRARPIGALS